MSLARRLLRGLTGSASDMTTDEYEWWQDQAALLDPLAYEYVMGTSQSRTVPAGQRYYLVNGWFLQSSGGGGSLFHRPLDVDQAQMLPAGTTLTTDSGTNTSYSFMYLCKPSLVTGSDSRYTSDPRGLYFTRIITLGTLTRYKLGAVDTGNAGATASFPNDFTYGFGLWTSVHDMSWLILQDSTANAGVNTQSEIGDNNVQRFTSRTYVPFARASFPKIAVRGANLASAASEFSYVKLPGGW